MFEGGRYRLGMIRKLATVFVLTAATVVGSPDAMAELKSPEVGTFFVEGFGGLVLPLNSFDNADAGTNLGGSEVTWWPRFQLGVAAGGRVWQPLNLDVGLRLGYSLQKYYDLGEIRNKYDPGMDVLEITSFGRGALFPFGTERWGVTMELGLGLVMAFGGKEGTEDFPRENQMMFRVRICFGAVWRFADSMGLAIDALSLVSDIPMTDFFGEVVGTAVAYEPRVGYFYRF
jgi:hypothetical protein